MTNILRGEFKSIVNIRIAFRIYQGIHGFCLSVGSLNLHRDQGSHGADKEICFKCRCFFFIIIKLIMLFNQSFPDNIFIQGTFIDSEVFVGAQIFLGFIVQHGHKKTGVGKV